MDGKDLLRNFPSAAKQKEWDSKLDSNAVDQKIAEFKENNDLDLSNKVDKEDGKVLSTNDFSTEYKQQLDQLNSSYDANKITENTNRRFVSDLEKTTWSAKETVEGAQAKATAAESAAKEHANSLNSTMDEKKLDSGEISGDNLILKANGKVVNTLPLPKGFSGSYTDLTNIPEEFVPSAHTHVIADITDFSVDNNLISDSTTNALSAKQGKALKSMIDDINQNSAHSHLNKDVLDKLDQETYTRWDNKYDDFEIVEEEIIFKANIFDEESGQVKTVEKKRGTLPKGFSGNYSDLAGAPTIIDNVTSTDTNNVLSANQGKVLKGIIDDVNSRVDSIHTFKNQAELDKVTDGKVALWDAKETTEGSQAKATQAETNAKEYADTKVSELVGTAPEALNTIQEIAAALNGDANIVETLTTEIGTKANKEHTHVMADITDLFKVENALTSNSTKNAISVAQAKLISDKTNKLEKTVNTLSGSNHGHENKKELDLIQSGDVAKWNAKAEGSHTHVATDITDDAEHRFVTDVEKAKWNNATDIDDEKEALNSTWSSKKIKQEMELTLLQTPYKALTVVDWELEPETGLYKSTVTHNMNSEELFISAYNTVTKANEFISYKILDPNTIEVRAEDGESIDLKIIGGAVNKIEIKEGGKEIDDSVQTASSTWSSNKIAEEIAALNARIDQLTSKK